jgi:hypothetical protein
MLLLTSAVAPAANAASGFIVSPPIIQPESSELVIYVGGISKDGTTLKPSSVSVEIDGQPGPTPKTTEVLSEYARRAAAEQPRWKSPLAVGLVYLWVKDIPAGMADAILEGIGGFCQRIPGRTHVYATLYGRKRQPIPRLNAAEIAVQLHDIGFLGGDRPNLGDAIRLDLKALLGDESPFKVLLVVTDGRDHDDETGEGSADFAALADEVERAGVKLMVVSFPSDDADAEESAKHLRALGSSGAIRRAVERPLGMQATLEALGQAIAELRRVRVDLPWGWRTFGGTRRIRLNVTTDGKERVLEVGSVSMKGGKPWLWALGVGLGLLVLGVGVWFYWRRRARGDEPNLAEEPPEVVAATHTLIERGLPASRILLELTRSHPEEIASLPALDAATFADERLPLFRTRPGRRRLEELLALLSDRTSSDIQLGSELADILAHAVQGQAAPDQVASSIVARVPEDQWGRLSRMGLDELSRALRASGGRHPVLATPRARSVALEVQAALRSESRNVGQPVTVGWLVRAAGRGTRGQTLRLPPEGGVLGQASFCHVRLVDDEQTAARHASITMDAGGFFVEPLQGTVKVEGRSVSGRTHLGDGDTIEIGQSRYVFKCVSTGESRGNRRQG